MCPKSWRYGLTVYAALRDSSIFTDWRTLFNGVERLLINMDDNCSSMRSSTRCSSQFTCTRQPIVYRCLHCPVAISPTRFLDATMMWSSDWILLSFKIRESIHACMMGCFIILPANRLLFRCTLREHAAVLPGYLSSTHGFTIAGKFRRS